MASAKMVTISARKWHMSVLLVCISAICNINADRVSDCPADKDKPWSYDDNLPNGPSHWGDNYPDCKTDNQSPINIVPGSAKHEANTRLRLALSNYDQAVSKGNFENLGYRVRVTPKDDVTRTLRLDGTDYTLQYLHFHWGNKTSPGSEHEINGNKYTMETHFIHKDDSGKLVVLGYFLQESSKSNKAIDSLLDVSPAIEHEGDNYEGQIPNPMDLEELVNDGCRYYKYEGSGSFPPCTPGVTWLVCRQNGAVKKSQLERLFKLYRVKKGSDSIEQCHLVDNYRPVQPLNGRTVYE